MDGVWINRLVLVGKADPETPSVFSHEDSKIMGLSGHVAFFFSCTPYMGVSRNRGTPSHHPFKWCFPSQKPSIFGIPHGLVETPIDFLPPAARGPGRHCGITWFWTLDSNVPLRYRPLLLMEGDLEADSVQVPVPWSPRGDLPKVGIHNVKNKFSWSVDRCQLDGL